MDAELARYAVTDIEGLEQREDVGRGAYGVVYEVKANGLPCIAKRLHDLLTCTHSVGQREISERFRNECILLSRQRSPHIVQFLGVHFGRDRYDLTLVMERMFTDLGKALGLFPNISLPLKLRILLDASHGLLYLHSQTPPIVHRDFTAANILLSSDMRAKVADLGMSRILDLHPRQLSILTNCPGALAYMPPEALKNDPVYDVKLDVFSFGHLALYTANQAFPEVRELGPQDANALRSGTGQIAKRQSGMREMGNTHCLYELVVDCLRDVPERRPTAKQVNSRLQALSVRHSAEDLHVLRYEEKCASLESESRKLKESLWQSREEVKQYQKEVDSLRDQVGKYSKEVGSLNDKLCHAEDLLEPMEMVKKRIQQSLLAAQSQLELKTTELEQCKMYVQECEEQITRYKGSIDTLAGEVARVCAELARVQEENRTMKKETASAKSSPPASLPTPSCETAQLSTEQLYTKLQGDYDTVRHDNDVLYRELEDQKILYTALQEIVRALETKQLMT